ncbi:uncharacterized protein A4U43_C09F140 [Asparagus officinalis]|uniref:DUF7054 domain-containing protein n=1 Tax=Asparagus officinalis TaxID=4686 RepID=A0A5P1E432_ASPOF|nr:uncharacterized protein A4U43_C09F140 [Asparagus officinalis]
MAPLQPSAWPQNSRNHRHGLQHEGGLIGGWKNSGGCSRNSNRGAAAAPGRSSSFHGRTTTTTTADLQKEIMRRPKTQPDLLAGIGGSAARKLVMASTDWTVHQLIAAAIKQYLKEGRRPLLPTTDPSAFGLHYSQFSFECLDPNGKLIGLGSRNFFLCPKDTTTTISASASASPTTTASSSAAAAAAPPSSSLCSTEADKAASKITIPWLRFMGFLF